MVCYGTANVAQNCDGMRCGTLIVDTRVKMQCILNMFTRCRSLIYYTYINCSQQLNSNDYNNKTPVICQKRFSFSILCTINTLFIQKFKSENSKKSLTNITKKHHLQCSKL